MKTAVWILGHPAFHTKLIMIFKLISFRLIVLIILVE